MSPSKPKGSQKGAKGRQNEIKMESKKTKRVPNCSKNVPKSNPERSTFQYSNVDFSFRQNSKNDYGTLLALVGIAPKRLRASEDFWQMLWQLRSIWQMLFGFILLQNCQNGHVALAGLTTVKGTSVEKYARKH